MSRRTYASEFELRAQPTGGVMIQGHAAVFGSRSQDLGGFVEQVDRHAFTKTVREADVRALFNHDPSALLGRTTAGTLRLGVDGAGLAYEVDIPDTTLGRDLQISMERGDVTQSSFGFRTIRDSWTQDDEGYPLRTLEEVSLHNGDVSPVTYPAYEETDTGVLRSLSKITGLSMNLLADSTPAERRTLVETLREAPVEDMAQAHVDAAESHMGTELECEDCGQMNPAESNYCLNCGERLVGDENDGRSAPLAVITRRLAVRQFAAF